ncbi:MAG: ATP-binding protein [Magnetococcales bacterium]|nr:ATP-binding protein [Magnetococcales bacterium]MBF0115977.1 ATP-binding protein [Magnetococcales bacterium]
MLIRFGVSNHYSYKEYQQFSMVASSTLKSDTVYHLPVKGLDDPLLPIAIIYGANASGKTNLLESWNIFVNVIINSYRASNEQDGIEREYFRLDEGMVNSPSRFDCDAMIGGIRHHYGFKINNHRVLEEWLYVYPEGRKQVWFHRNHSNSPEYYFGPHLKGKKQTLAEFTSKNSLFISVAASNAHPQLSLVRNYFRDQCIMLRSTSLSNISQLRNVEKLDSGEYCQRLVNFLVEGDIGIAEIKFEELPVSKEVSDNIIEQISGHIRDTSDTNLHVSNTIEVRQKVLRIGHRDINNNLVFFDPDLESKGTLALLRLAEAVFAVLDKGGTLWIDELSAHLHPILVDKIVSLFGSPETNPNQAQLICITHDTHLLTLPVIHRDQIWFTEKDTHGASRLFPLTDFHVRSRDNIQKDYLRGVYGGIPYLGTPGLLLGKDF